jgi:Arc/MetJ family transcription regulator
MGRTNIVLDEKLVAQTMKITGIKTQRELVDFALREIVRHATQMRTLELKGKINWQGNLDKSRRKRNTS